MGNVILGICTSVQVKRQHRYEWNGMNDEYDNQYIWFDERKWNRKRTKSNKKIKETRKDGKMMANKKASQASQPTSLPSANRNIEELKVGEPIQMLFVTAVC